MLSSLTDRERRPIRIEFLTLQGKPNTHAWGAKSSTQQFPFLSRPWIRVTHLDYWVRLLCTRMLTAWERCVMFEEGESKVHSQVQLGTLLTDYHISRYVASTFKCLTITTTHCGLSIFSLNRRGLNHKYHPITPPVNLIIAVCGKPVKPIISREAGNHSTFTGPN